MVLALGSELSDRPTTDHEAPIDPELAGEQAYVTGAYARLEAMKAAAEMVRAAYSDVRAGGTHQARLERDIAWDVTQRRLTDLDIGESPLIFGRLDMDDSSRWYVGRLAVEDEEHTPLVVDWRAPVSRAFYQASARDPQGVAVRRRFGWAPGSRGESGDLTGLEDEHLDRGESRASEIVAREIERPRVGPMRDIAATAAPVRVPRRRKPSTRRAWVRVRWVTSSGCSTICAPERKTAWAACGSA